MLSHVWVCLLPPPCCEPCKRADGKSKEQPLQLALACILCENRIIIGAGLKCQNVRYCYSLSSPHINEASADAA